MGTLEFAVVGLVGSGVGAALATPMVWAGRRPRTADTRLIGWGLMGSSAIAALISARLVGLLPDAVAVEHVINVVGLGTFPLLCLYVRAQAGHRAPLRPFWWLWLPAGLYGLVLTGRLLLGMSTHVPFIWILPAAVGFTLFSAASLRRGEDGTRSAVIPARWIVAAMGVINVAQIVRLVLGDVAPVPAAVPVAVAITFVAMAGIVSYGAARAPVDAGLPSGRPRYERSGLDAAAAAQLLLEIERAMSADRLFARPDLTLRRLATAAGATPHQVSEALNRHGLTFHGLLSRCRVEDVKAQLLAPDAERFTIEGIGASAGFRSRSSMYAAFRRLEGMTPAEFRARASARGGAPDHTAGSENRR